QREIVSPLDVAAGTICLDAEDDVAQLPVVADLAATERAMRFPVRGEVGKGRRAERVVEVLIAERVAAEAADIGAGPVVDARGSGRRLHGQVCGESRRPQGKYTERDGGEEDSFHCEPLSNCPESAGGGGRRLLHIRSG